MSDYYFPGIRDAATDRHESLLVEILISWRRRTTNTTNEIYSVSTEKGYGLRAVVRFALFFLSRRNYSVFVC